jgi:hypothetical protein
VNEDRVDAEFRTLPQNDYVERLERELFALEPPT